MISGQNGHYIDFRARQITPTTDKKFDSWSVEPSNSAADGRGNQGRLAKVFNLDTAAHILLRRAANCVREMRKYPTELHAVWRLFASPDIAQDFNLAAEVTEAAMAADWDDENKMHATHAATLTTQNGVHARRVAVDMSGRLRNAVESFALLVRCAREGGWKETRQR